MLSNTQLNFFAKFIEKELGIIYSEQVYYQLQQRIEKVVEYLGLRSPEELYVSAIEKGITGDFKAFLLDIATNNETSFFRDSSIFRAIEEYVLPDLRVQYKDAFTYRVWSAASSFGQEPYSVAMLVHEMRQNDPTYPRVEIRASDISDQALKRSRSARYTQLEIQRGLQAARLVKYFRKTEDSSWQLNSEISSMVDFTKKNLLDNFSDMGKFHVILCRYVLIYQDAAKKKDIFTRLVQCLHPRGFLIMGGSESAIGLSHEMEQVEHKGAVFYRRKT